MKIEDFLNVDTVFEDPGNTQNESRYSELSWLISQFEDAEPFCAEFGVWQGVTINHCAKERPDINWHGFDSFEGLPEDWDCGGKMCEKGKFSTDGKLPQVEWNVMLYKGWFDETLPRWKEQYKDKHFTFLHMDADLYSSTIYVLNELNDMIVPGTLIRFDEFCDWRAFTGEPYNRIPRSPYSTWKEHEWKALNEWCDKYGRVVEPISRNWCQSSSIRVLK